MLGGKIASIGDPIFFSTNSFNVKLNGRFISKNTSYPKNLSINSNYEINEDDGRKKIDIVENHEIMYANSPVTFGTETFPFYVLFFDKQFNIINNIVEYLLVETYTYANNVIIGTKIPTDHRQKLSETFFPSETEQNSDKFVVNKPNDYYKFVNDFLFNNGPYSFDKTSKKYLFLSSNPNILHKYSFANKFKELMDILYSPTEDNDQELKEKIITMFGSDGEKSYENLSDMYYMFDRRVSQNTKIKENIHFNETFIDILGIQEENKVSKYLDQDIEEIKIYKKFIKICDLNPIFYSTYGVKLSIIFFSIYIQTRLSKTYITRGDIPINLYPINKTNFLLNLLGNIEYDDNIRAQYAIALQRIHSDRQNTSLKENLSGPEVLVYTYGLKLYDYDQARFQGIKFPNCVENALTQILKTFCWTGKTYNLEIIKDARQEFKDFMADVFTKPNYDNSSDMKDKFSELISVETTHPDNIKFNSTSNDKKYNIKSTYKNFLYFLKKILNIRDDSQILNLQDDYVIYQKIKDNNNFIKDITVTYLRDARNTYQINITYKDKLTCIFNIYDGHSAVNVKSTSIDLDSFTVQERLFFLSFASDFNQIYKFVTSFKSGNTELDYFNVILNLIKKKIIFEDILTIMSQIDIYNICRYFIIVDSLYISDGSYESHILLFINSIIEYYYKKKNINELNRFEIMLEDNYPLLKKFNLNNLNFEIDQIFFTVIHILNKIIPINTSKYQYLDKFYRTIKNTLTFEHIFQQYIDKKWVTITNPEINYETNYFFNSFVFHYLYFNSNIFEILYKTNKKIILGDIIITSYRPESFIILKKTCKIIFKFLLHFLKPDENNLITNPYIDFSVLTYFLKLIFFNTTDQYKTELKKVLKELFNLEIIITKKFQNGILSYYIQSLTKYYLIKVFDCILKRQFDNAIFLYDLVKNLTVYTEENKKVILINTYLLENFITLNRELCVEFITHNFNHTAVDIKNLDYTFDYNDIPLNSYDAKIPRYSIDKKLTQTWSSKAINKKLSTFTIDQSQQINSIPIAEQSNPNYNPLKNDMDTYFKKSKVSSNINGGDEQISKYQKYANKYLQIKKNMQGGKYQILGINVKPFDLKFPIFIGKRNIIKNTDPNNDHNQNYILNNKFELVKLSQLHPSDPSNPIESYDPIRYKKNKSLREIKKQLERTNSTFLGINFSQFENIIKENPEETPDPNNIDTYKKMQKFICTNKFKQFVDLVFDPNNFFINESDENKQKKILLITKKKDVVLAYNRDIKPFNSSMMPLTKNNPNINFILDLVPEINVPDYVIEKETNGLIVKQINQLDEQKPIQTIIKSIQKFNQSKFIKIPGTVMNTLIENAKKAGSEQIDFLYPNPNKEQSKQLQIKKLDPITVNINIENNNLEDFVEQIRDYNETQNLESVINRLYQLFPSVEYYQNLSDTFEYYFNSEINGYFYVYRDIKVLDKHVFDDLEFIHKLKSDQTKYNKFFFINFIKFIFNNNYKLEIPIHEASLYENLFGLDQPIS